MSFALIEGKEQDMKKLNGRVITTRFIEDEEAKDKLKILANHWGVGLPEAVTYAILTAFECRADEIADQIRRAASNRDTPDEPKRKGG